MSYENVDTLIVTLEYTDLNDKTISEVLDEMKVDYEAGVEDYVIDFVK